MIPGSDGTVSRDRDSRSPELPETREGVAPPGVHPLAPREQPFRNPNELSPHHPAVSGANGSPRARGRSRSLLARDRPRTHGTDGPGVPRGPSLGASGAAGSWRVGGSSEELVPRIGRRAWLAGSTVATSVPGRAGGPSASHGSSCRATSPGPGSEAVPDDVAEVLVRDARAPPPRAHAGCTTRRTWMGVVTWTKGVWRRRPKARRRGVASTRRSSPRRAT